MFRLIDQFQKKDNSIKIADQAWEIKAETIMDYLQTLPPHETHCAEMAVGAFYMALSDYQEIKKSPCKKSYRMTSR
jgi:nitrogen fixation NifU-like protein